jgi:hypothetical protein
MDQIEKDKLKKLLKDFDSDISTIKTRRQKIKGEIDRIEQQRK